MVPPAFSAAASLPGVEMSGCGVPFFTARPMGTRPRSARLPATILPSVSMPSMKATGRTITSATSAAFLMSFTILAMPSDLTVILTPVLGIVRRQVENPVIIDHARRQHVDLGGLRPDRRGKHGQQRAKNELPHCFPQKNRRYTLYPGI